MWYQISNIISLLRDMSTFGFKLKAFNCRTMAKILIHIKSVKNANLLGIVRKSERTRKNIPANVKTSSHPNYVCLQISTFQKICLYSNELILFDYFLNILFFSFHTIFIFSFHIKVLPLKFNQDKNLELLTREFY